LIVKGKMVETLPPTIPETSIARISEFLECSEASEIVASFSALLSSLQVFAARMDDLPRSDSELKLNDATSVTGATAYQMPINTAVELRATISNFFNFARFKTEAPPVGPTEKQVAAVRLFLHLPDDAAADYKESNSILTRDVCSILKALNTSYKSST